MTTLARPVAFTFLIVLSRGPQSGVFAETPVSPASPGIDLAGLDRSVAPGDDFFRYANGTWLKTTEIPADRPSAGSDVIVAELTSQRTADLIKEAAQSTAPEARKVGDYYASYMDEAGIEARGLRPLQPTLDRIAAITDRKGLARYLGGTLLADVDALNATDMYTDNIFGLWVAQDLNDPARYLPFLMQGGLDMPDRAYYLDPSPRMETIRGKFRDHDGTVLGLAKVEGARDRAGRIYDLERKIAEAHWSREDSGDVKKANNHWTRAQFDTFAPGMDWSEYFAAAGLGAARDFGVWQPSAVTGISAPVASEPIEAWKDDLTFHAIEHFAAGLPDADRAERFELARNLRKLGKPVDRSEWVMTPQTVNAVNLPVMNALNFLASILQPPYFDPGRPVVMDYGAIGAVIGHEISHSFDDS